MSAFNLKKRLNIQWLIGAAVLLYVPVAAAGLKSQTAPDLGRPVAVRSTPAASPATLAAAATPTPTPTATPAPVAAPTPAPATPKPKPKATPRVLAAAQTPAPATGDMASEAACPGQGSVASTKAALTCLTAYARSYHGLVPTTAHDTVMAAAASKVTDMVNCGYSHTACGHASNYWLGQHGYTGRCSGENIAFGQSTPRAVFTSWMNSPGHRANILNASYRHLGVAVAPGKDGKLLWVMQLGGC